ncbi:hypothetical protein [Streptomyces sp. NPDC002845]
MADEHYKWLDRDAAERLLRGEPLEAVDADTRAQADRLAGALDALSAEVPPADSELRGEEAALAAFRKARAELADEDPALKSGRRGHRHASTFPADSGLVRLGRPGRPTRRARLVRPVRYGMAAALAAGMIGGVAVAAGSGALPTPFRDDSPRPAASVSAAVPPDRPLVSPPAGESEGGARSEPTPDGSADGSSGNGTSNDTARGNPDGTGRPVPDGFANGQGRSPAWRNGILSSCRDMSDGKSLDADRRRNLEKAAGGTATGRVKKYCDGVLNNQSDRSPADSSPDNASDRSVGGNDSRSGKSDKSGEDEGDSQGGKDKGKGSGRNNGHGNGKGNNGDGKGNGRSSGGNHHRTDGGATTPVAAPDRVTTQPVRPTPAAPRSGGPRTRTYA